MWCWWCCHECPGEPLCLPYKHDPLRNKFYTMGNFCSWGCMKAYNMTYNRVRAGIIACNMVLMYKHMYGHVDPIRCAPNRYALKEFGGKMSIEEFRSAVSSRVLVHMPDQVHVSHEVVTKNEIKSTQDCDTRVSKIQEISFSTTNNETLKIKRPKPLKRDGNNLEKTLGITRSRKV
jgi:hypothetical protein